MHEIDQQSNIGIGHQQSRSILVKNFGKNKNEIIFINDQNNGTASFVKIIKI